MSLSEAKPSSAVDELLDAVGRLSTTDLEHFSDEVMRIRARRLAPTLPRREAELLEQINRGLPPHQDRRYRELVDKRDDESLTAAEHRELIDVGDEVERLIVERVRAMGELAMLRGTTLQGIAAQFQLPDPEDG
jgi:hypothetical protein